MLSKIFLEFIGNAFYFHKIIDLCSFIRPREPIFKERNARRITYYDKINSHLSEQSV